MVSTLDFESSDPSSNLGRTFDFFFQSEIHRQIRRFDTWRRRQTRVDETDSLRTHRGVVKSRCRVASLNVLNIFF